MKSNGIVRKPKALDLENMKNADKSKYCILHEDCGHENKNCNGLKIQVGKEI